jgi:hypothetical protein
MSNQNYNSEQQEALTQIRGLMNQLIKVEKLSQDKYKPSFNWEGHMRQAVADIALDNYQSYQVLEERLRKTITEARDLGLTKDPLVKRIRKLAFG